MAPEGVFVLAIAITVWGSAVAIKAFHALRTNQPYVFSMWDGGMVRAGKRLNKLGTQIKVVTGLLEAAGCVALLTEVVPRNTAVYAVLFVLIFSAVTDFAAAE